MFKPCCFQVYVGKTNYDNILQHFSTVKTHTRKNKHCWRLTSCCSKLLKYRTVIFSPLKFNTVIYWFKVGGFITVGPNKFVNGVIICNHHSRRLSNEMMSELKETGPRGENSPRRAQVDFYNKRKICTSPLRTQHNAANLISKSSANTTF